MKASLKILKKKLTKKENQIAILKIFDVKETKRINIRVRLYNPLGERFQLYLDTLVVFPGEDSEIILPYEATEKVAGFYKYDVKIWIDGLLCLTETVETDNFLIEDVEVIDYKSTLDNTRIVLKNKSMEEADVEFLSEKEIILNKIIGANIKETFSIPSTVKYIRVAGELKPLKEDSKIYYRQHNLFWRVEGENEVFVYDPKAEGKRRLILKGFAKELWMLSDGVVPIKLSEEEKLVMDKIMEYNIIKEIV